MEKIYFTFPLFLFSYDDPEDSEAIDEEASITPVRLDSEPYEAVLNARGYGYHLIFGRQANGHFLCIPDWDIGCELSSYDDTFWNEESLMKVSESTGKIDYNDVSAICYALKTLKSHLSH